MATLPYARRYNKLGVPQGTEFRVNTSPTNSQTLNDLLFPAVALDADGDFVVVWENGRSDIVAQRYNNAGVPQGGEFQVNTSTAGSHKLPAVSADADGDFVVTWGGGGVGGDYDIFAQRYNNAGAPQGGEFQVNTFTTNSQESPAIALDADGDFVVTWSSYGQDGSRYGIFAQRYNNAGAPQGDEFQVNTFTTNVQALPDIALDADGDFVVTWVGFAIGNGYDIFAQRYNTEGVRQGDEFRVNTFTTDLQSEPAVAVDADGDFVVAWESIEGGFGLGIFAQRYNNLGLPQGDEFQVNSSVFGFQGTPDITLDADGDFVVSWNNYGRDGSGFGIYAQRFMGGKVSVICGGLPATLIGTPGNDTLTGTSGPDVIVGLAGNDTINGLGGNDIFCGGPGNDTLIGGGGSDTINFAGPLGVVVNLATGTASGQGNDNLSGIENVTGSRAADSLTGNAGINVLSGGLGNDTLNGAGGNDTASFAAAAVAVNANLGTGTATGQGSDTLLNLENLTGSRENDVLTGNGGNNRLKGANGNDIMNGGAGTDTCDGQSGAGDTATACETVIGVP